MGLIAGPGRAYPQPGAGTVQCTSLSCRARGRPAQCENGERASGRGSTGSAAGGVERGGEGWREVWRSRAGPEPGGGTGSTSPSLAAPKATGHRPPTALQASPPAAAPLLHQPQGHRSIRASQGQSGSLSLRPDPDNTRRLSIIAHSQSTVERKTCLNVAERQIFLNTPKFLQFIKLVCKFLAGLSLMAPP